MIDLSYARYHQHVRVTIESKGLLLDGGVRYAYQFGYDCDVNKVISYIKCPTVYRTD